MRRDGTKTAIHLLTVRATERQAESQEKHATVMRFLTFVLTVVALVQIIPEQTAFAVQLLFLVILFSVAAVKGLRWLSL